MKNKGWIHSPAYDLFFIFLGLLLILFVGLFYSKFLIKTITVGAFAILLRLTLSPSHFIAPVLLLLFNKDERQKVLNHSPHYYKICNGIIVINLLLFGTAAALYTLQSPFSYVYAPVALIGGLFYFFNAWHFATQQFGIIQIYRSASELKHPNRKLEFVFCLLALFILPMPFIFAAGIRDHFFSYHFGNFQWTEGTKIFVSVVLVALTSLLVLIFKAKGRANLQIVLTYIQIICMSGLICVLPGVFSLLVFSFSHWIQELFLISLIHSRSDRQSRSYKLPSTIWINLSGLIMFGFFVALIYHKTPLFSKNKFFVFGQFQGMFHLSPLEFLFAALLSGVFMSLTFIHFYTDKLIYKGREWRRDS